MGAQNQSLSTLFQMMLVFAEVVEWQNFSSWRAAGRRLRWTSVFVSAEYNCVNPRRTPLPASRSAHTGDALRSWR